MLRTLMAGAAAFTASLAPQASAQDSNGATMFNRGHFKGARHTVIGPTQFSQPFVMKSVMIPAGTSWEFCSGSTYSGCREISESKPAMVMNVRSARPVAAVLPASATSGPSSAAEQALRGAGQSLRGLASEYFVAPNQGGIRVEVQPGTAEAMSRRALEFCRARGWRSSVHERLQSVGSRFYLADVLCADTAR